MQLDKPQLFIEHNFGNAKLKYIWYQGIDIRFMEQRNPRLYNQLIKLNCKAATGLTIAACEWILWRLESWREKDSNLQKEYLQALWISLISKEYTTKEEVGSTVGSKLSKEEEPMELINYYYNDIRLNYNVHHPSIYYNAVNMIELARYVSDDTDFFDSWFNSIIGQSTELFPVPTDDLDEKGVFQFNEDEDFDPYQMIKEPFIPREFYFEPGFDYQTADLKQLQKKLLDSVDYNENRFLSSPERMISIDFVGVPYQVND